MSELFDKFLKKFQKSKSGKLFDVLWELREARHEGTRLDKLSYVCSALWIISEGTKYESDVKEIIMECCPEFFND